MIPGSIFNPGHYFSLHPNTELYSGNRPKSRTALSQRMCLIWRQFSQKETLLLLHTLVRKNIDALHINRNNVENRKLYSKINKYMSFGKLNFTTLLVPCGLSKCVLLCHAEETKR